jgi:hypothetical protein
MLSSSSKRLCAAAALASSATVAVAGEPYYLISHGLADGSVIAVYGWPDNGTPCRSLANHMNETMKVEGNPHRFSCVDGTTAMEIDCGSGNTQARNCTTDWKVRNGLLRRQGR